MPQPQQCQIWALSATYTSAHGHARSLIHLAHGHARSLIHLARPWIEPTTSGFLVGFISTVPLWELPLSFFLVLFSYLERWGSAFWGFIINMWTSFNLLVCMMIFHLSWASSQPICFRLMLCLSLQRLMYFKDIILFIKKALYFACKQSKAQNHPAHQCGCAVVSGPRIYLGFWNVNF